jgi:microcompartment protein CcmK/EutM
MILAKVSGTVVPSVHSVGIDGARFLLIESCSPEGRGFGDYLAALDLVDARTGDIVLVAQGSSCRWTFETDDKPVDALIVGIIDAVDSGNRRLYG